MSSLKEIHMSFSLKQSLFIFPVLFINQIPVSYTHLFTVSLIPFIYMLSDLVNACLNVLLFVPFGFFLPMLWKEFRSIKSVALAGIVATSFIEISQLFTGRATDIDDIITNLSLIHL